MAGEERILTTHVGSLARPQALLDAIVAMDKGVPVDAKAFDTLLRNSVAKIVEEQARAKVDIVSDGEYGRDRKSVV